MLLQPGLTVLPSARLYRAGNLMPVSDSKFSFQHPLGLSLMCYH